MEVALVGPDFEENLSLRYLAAALRAAGHHPRLVPFNSARDTESAVRAARGHALVGLSLCFQARAPEFLALAARLKRESPGTVIVAGGHFASCAADAILADNPALDAIAVHEGERTIVELARACESRPASFGSILGLVYRHTDGSLVRTAPRPVERDLDALPEPERTGPVPLLAGIPTAFLLGSRGCLGACTYCCISTLHRLAPGPSFRQRAAEAVADEMARLFHDKAVRHFVFHDDNFLLPSARANHHRIDALAAALAARQVQDIAFTIKCRPCDLEADVLARLRGLGLVRVFLGIESATTRGLACLGRGHTLAEGERALALCDEHDVSAQFNILMFHPAATPATIRDDLAFMRRHRHHPLNFCRAELYAGTPLEQRLLAEGKARGGYLGRTYALDDAAAERAWQLAARVFRERCWAPGGSLMQMAIGLDHLAALVERCRPGRRARGFRRHVGRWLGDVNHGMLVLLERIMDLVEEPAAERALEDLAAPILAQERREREALLARYLELRRELQSQGGNARSVPSWARYAAAVALATSMGGCANTLFLSRPPPPARALPPDAGLATDVQPADVPAPQPFDDGICEYAPGPPPPPPPASISNQEVELAWFEASSRFYDYFDQAPRRLPARIQVHIQAEIAAHGGLGKVELEDRSGALDAGLLAGLKQVFESVRFPEARTGRQVNYDITFDLSKPGR